MSHFNGSSQERPCSAVSSRGAVPRSTSQDLQAKRFSLPFQYIPPIRHVSIR